MRYVTAALALACADQLVGSVNRLVVDKTGISGRFDVTLKWASQLTPGSDLIPGDDRISLFTALQEQLGLRLQPDTGPVEMIIIERASRPTPDERRLTKGGGRGLRGGAARTSRSRRRDAHRHA